MSNICAVSREIDRHLADEDRISRRQEALDATADVIADDLVTFQHYAIDGKTVCDMGDLWASLTEALADLESPKSLADARAAFEETFNRVCREHAESLAPLMLASQSNWRANP